MELHYLDFDTSEDADGAAVFDAMASVAAGQLPALWAEVAAVLGWAHREFPDARAPLDEGGEWDYLLEGATEVRTPQVLEFDSASGGIITATPGTPAPARHALTLSITGTPGFSDAFRSAFGMA
jgi:hypothetical protein